MELESVLNFLDVIQQAELKTYIEASDNYYNDEAQMSDPEFDELTAKLLSYQIPQLTAFIQKGIARNGKIEEVTELTQEMISLFKIKYKNKSSIADIKKFFRTCQKQLYYAAKFDGNALKITWDFSEETPKLVRIQSRGGLDITEAFKNHPDIINTHQYHERIVCGELLLRKNVFAEKYSDEYENARNFVGSIIKRASSSVTNEVLNIVNDLSFEGYSNGINPMSFIGKDTWKKLTPEILYNLEDVIKQYKSDDFPYLCDGIVIAFPESGERQIKDNYPLNMVAVKFPAPRARAKVIGIEWTQKKSGKLTPKVLIEPTKLEGSTITCANGYNYENIINSGIGIGAIIEIEKSGDIIPVVAKVLVTSNNIPMPTCEYRRSGKHLIAINLEESRKYKFVLALKHLNIDGIGDTLANQIGECVDFDIIELFNTKYKPDICVALGGGANWKKFQEIYNIKTMSLDMLIMLLQFDNVGPVIAKCVAEILLKINTSTKNMADDIVQNVCKGAGFVKIASSMRTMNSYGIKIIKPIEINEETITYEMTGDPTDMTKSKFKEKFAELYPNALHTSLTKNTKYLFTNDLSSNTSKMNKARKYNITIVSYDDALKNKLS